MPVREPFDELSPSSVPTPLSVGEVKTVIAAIISSRIAKFRDIASAIQQDETAIKQFQHRKSRRPRKTRLFHALSSYISRLPPNDVDAICATDPSIRDIFWRRENTGTQSTSLGLEGAFSDIFLHGQLENGPFYEKYQVFQVADSIRSDSEKKIVQRTILQFRYVTGRLEFNEEKYDIVSDSIRRVRSVTGLVVQMGRVLCLIGQAAGSPEFTWLTLPNLGEDIRKPNRNWRFVENQEAAEDYAPLVGVSGKRDHFVPKADKYNFAFGLRVHAESEGVPAARKVVMLAFPFVSRPGLGKANAATLPRDEKLYLNKAFQWDLEIGEEQPKYKLGDPTFAGKPAL